MFFLVLLLPHPLARPVGGPPPIGLSALVKSSATAAFLLQVKTQLALEHFGGKAAPAEDSGGKTELPVEVWLGNSARRLPNPGEVVGNDEWPVPQDQVNEQKQHGNICFQQPAGGLGRSAASSCSHWLSCC